MFEYLVLEMCTAIFPLSISHFHVKTCWLLQTLHRKVSVSENNAQNNLPLWTEVTTTLSLAKENIQSIANCFYEFPAGGTGSEEIFQ